MSSAGQEKASSGASLVSSLRRPRALHYSVVAVTAVGILFLYYAYRQALPASSGHYLEWFWSVFYFEFNNHVLGILMLVPILYAAIMLGWKRAAFIVVALLVAIAPYVAGFSYGARTLFESFSLLAIPPALIIAIEMLLITSARERMTLAEKTRQRAEVMRQTFSIQENERLRISQDLHDSVAQTLLVNASVAHNMIEGNKQGTEAIRAAFEAIKENSLGMVAEIRCICQDLRPSVLDNLGLVSSLKWLVDNLSEETGARVELNIAGKPRELTPDENVAVFRIVQEVLSNIKKHAEARKVDVDIAFDDRGMSIVIRDDGQGFDLARDVHRYGLDGKLGILGMHERAQSIGAALAIDSAGGRGTKVTIRIDSEQGTTLPAP